MDNNQTIEIDLVKVIQYAWAEKISVFIIGFVSTAFIVGISYFVTPIFQVQTTIAPVSSDMSSKSASSQLSGLASIVGVGGTAVSDESTVQMATFESRKFIREFIYENKIIDELYKDKWNVKSKSWDGAAPTLWEAVNYFELNVRNISINKETGIITLTLQWEDPVIAVEWSNKMVNRINTILHKEFIAETERNLEYLNEKLTTTQNADMRAVLFNLIQEEVKKEMLSSSDRNFAYKTIDPPVIPDKRSSPRRIFYAVFGAFFGGLIGLVYAWVKGSRKEKVKAASTL